MYLFSQQAKAEISQFFLFSSGNESVETLSTGLERDIIDIRDQIEKRPGASELSHRI